jgi:hypothetical protein
VDDFAALTPAERALLEALNRRGVRFIVIGLGAAVLQDLAALPALEATLRARNSTAG